MCRFARSAGGMGLLCQLSPSTLSTQIILVQPRARGPCIAATRPSDVGKPRTRPPPRPKTSSSISRRRDGLDQRWGCRSMAMPVRLGVNWGEVRPAAEAFLRSPARVPMLSWSRAGGDRVARIQRLADDLVLIDTDDQRSPESIAVYLLLGDRPALIETGPASTVETVLQGVRAAGLDPRDLQAAAVTHIHLDHAGGAGTLAQRFPPPPDRAHVVKDGDVLPLGSRRMKALETPGHASHHHAYLDEASGDLFTGDAAGVAMPGSRYVGPPTPPPDFDVPAWKRTLARMRAVRASRLLLTHFGPHTWVDDLLTQLEGWLDAREQFARQIAAAGGGDRKS